MVTAISNVSDLTQKVERKIYELRYGDSKRTIITNNLAKRIKSICINEGICYPLNESINNVDYKKHGVYGSLRLLAEKYGIIL